MPSRSGLQSTIRRIAPETLQRVNQLLMSDWVDARRLPLASQRIDSTVVASNIAPPSDSQLLADTRLRNFRAGIEGDIPEWKRAFGASKATWKGYDGFKAFVWSSVLSYNLTRMVRFSSG